MIASQPVDENVNYRKPETVIKSEMPQKSFGHCRILNYKIIMLILFDWKPIV